MSIQKLKEFISQKFSLELPRQISYHGFHHTLHVLKVCNDYIRRLKINSKDAKLLRTAALFHDVGVLWDYQNHEAEGVEFMRKTLPQWGYSKSDIEIVANMIYATKLPQSPKTELEQILCDADVDYLGTDLFYEIGETLYQEFLSVGVVKSEEDWDRLQVKFLENHKYHTPFAQKNREPRKRKYIQAIKDKWQWK